MKLQNFEVAVDCRKMKVVSAQRTTKYETKYVHKGVFEVPSTP